MQPTLARNTNPTVSAPRRDNINWYWFRVFGAVALTVNFLYAIILVVMAPVIIDRSFGWWLTLCFNGSLSLAYLVDLIKITNFARAVAPLNGKTFGTQFRQFYKGGYSWEQMHEQLEFAHRFGANGEYAAKVRAHAQFYPEITEEIESRLASGDWRKIPTILANAERRTAARMRQVATTQTRREARIAALRTRAKELRFDLFRAEQMIEDEALSELSDALSRLAANRDLEARAEKLGIEQQVGAMLREGQFTAAHALVIKLEANQEAIVEQARRDEQFVARRDSIHDELRARINALPVNNHKFMFTLYNQLTRFPFEGREYRKARYVFDNHLAEAEKELSRLKARSKR